MSKATTHLDDVEKPDYSGDGKSSIEISRPHRISRRPMARTRSALPTWPVPTGFSSR